MRIVIKIIFVFVTVMVNAGLAEELPFGAKDMFWRDSQGFSQEMHAFRDTLGFNHFWDHWTYAQIQEGGDYGVKIIYQGGSGDPIYRNTFYHWLNHPQTKRISEKPNNDREPQQRTVGGHVQRAAVPDALH